MSRLFIHFYLDEDVSVLVAKLLRSRGFELSTTQDAGNLGANDADQLEFAAAGGMTIVMHNRVHFEGLAREYYSNNKTHGGIIIAVRRPANQIARRLLILLDSTTSEEMRDQVRYI